MLKLIYIYGGSMEDIKKTREMPTVTNDVDFNRNKWFFSIGGIGRDKA